MRSRALRSGWMLKFAAQEAMSYVMLEGCRACVLCRKTYCCGILVEKHFGLVIEVLNRVIVYIGMRRVGSLVVCNIRD